MLLMTWKDPERTVSGNTALIPDSSTEEAVRRNNHRMSRPQYEVDAALADVAMKLLTDETRVEPIARCLLEHACALTNSEQGWVGSNDPATGKPRVLIGTGMMTSGAAPADADDHIALETVPDGLHADLWEHALKTREPFFHNTPHSHPASGSGSGGRPCVRNFLAVPVIAGGELLGQIALADAPDGYSGENVGIVKRLADLYGMFLRQRFIKRQLQHSETRFRRTANLATDLAYSYTGTLETGLAIDWLTGAAERMTGYTAEQIKALRCWSTLVHEEDRPLFYEHVLNASPGTPKMCELRLRHRDGGLIWAASFAQSVRDEQAPNLVQIYGVMTDITSRREAEETMRVTAAAIDSTRDGVMITDLEPRIVVVNRAFVQVTGYREEEALGRNPSLLKSGRHDPAFYQALWSTLRATGHWEGEIWNRRKNGAIYPAWQTISTVRDAEARATHYVAIFSDFSQRKLSESRLERMAHYDPLTELPNRLLVESRLEHALDRACRRNGRLAVLFIDLDRFKTVNDSLGHPAGDELLAAVAHRLGERLRKEDTLGRLGGDEFLVIVEDLRRAEDAAVVARALLESLESVFTLRNGQEISIRASIGISIYPDHGADAAELIRTSDAAMYWAKGSGRNAVRCYTAALTQEAAARLQTETRLRLALERDELVLHYQPVVSVRDGALIGAEALVRWQPAGGELVLPARFIQIAEETGLIGPLGEWVLRQTCRQAKAWLDQGLSFESISLNLSVRQLQRHSLESFVRSALSETGLAPACLELEITESGLMDEQSERNLRAVQAMGVRLSIDDFGTGYSSLIALKRLTLDRLKIDCSFIRNIPNDPDQMAIASAVISMAHQLGLRALAEGVETEAQLDFLRQQGCDAYQGFLFCPPLPAEEFAARFLRSAD